MKRNYHTIETKAKNSERDLTKFVAANGQFVLPMVELIEQSRLAMSDLIDVTGRLTIETVLHMSAKGIAGEPSQGKQKEGEIGWHGSRAGSVHLKERKLKVTKPRLRQKGKGEDVILQIPENAAAESA